MKKIIFTLFLCSIAIFYTGCEQIATIIASQSGCLLPDADNYDPSKLLACTDGCVADSDGNMKSGSNCCCAEITYGCTDPTKLNYSASATAPCKDGLCGGTDNCCCIAAVNGCTDTAASNYNSLANTDDGTCSYEAADVTLADGTTASVVYGCMNTEACNYLSTAQADCNQENASISGSSWVQNDDCCDLSAHAKCYLDLNNNGYYEEVDSTSSSLPLCNCGSLGVGWVSADDVANDVEVQGCTSPINTGFSSAVAMYMPCVEYNPGANVDNGGCCLEELTEDDIKDAVGGEAIFDMIGMYDLEFTAGWWNNTSNVCVEYTDDNFYGGASISELTLGPPSVNGIGQLQFYEEFADSFAQIAQWEYHVPNAQNEDACNTVAEQNEGDSWWCGNWGYEYEACENFMFQQDCPHENCHWETNFCHPTFQGQPCHEINDQTTCQSSDCEWDTVPYNPMTNDYGVCYTPNDIPGDHCWGMDEYECGYDDDCELKDDFDNCQQCNCAPNASNTDPACVNICCGGGGGGGDGAPACIMECAFPSTGLDTDSGHDMCAWITSTLFSSSDSPMPCIDGCSNETLYDDDGNSDGTVAEMLANLNSLCDVCLEDASGNSCDQMWDSQQGGGDGPSGPGGPGGPGGGPDVNCGGFNSPATCSANISKDSCFCDMSCVWEGEENGTCVTDVCHSQTSTTCASVTGCEIVYPGNPQYNCSTPNGCCVGTESYDEGPGCIGDCPGVAGIGLTSTADEICTFITGIWGSSGDNTCVQDCSMDEWNFYNAMDGYCDICLTNSFVDCGSYNFGDFLDGNDFYPIMPSYDALDIQIGKANAVSELNNSLSRSSSCETGYIKDCSGDGDCCDELWLGDGYPDCQDQEYGCDLSCYNNDGQPGGVGDCGDGGFGSAECVPSNPCWHEDNAAACGFMGGCVWNFNAPTPFCHPQPENDASDCGSISNQTWCQDNDLCAWISDPQGGNHCAPAAQGGDCHGYNSRFDCNNSASCQWDAPDWMEDWQTGACFSHNPCITPQNNNPDSCESSPGCTWDWGMYQCVESGAGNNYCDCRISHTQRSCEDATLGGGAGIWELPPWAMPGDNYYECMMPISQQDCYHDHQDVCNQFFNDGNESTEWKMIDGKNTCIKTFSFFEAGTWSIASDGDICWNWTEEPQPNCADLNTEDECYCFDCEWSNQGVCQPWPYNTGGNRLGREQYQMHKYQETVMNLSGSSNSSNSDNCFEITTVGNGFQIVEYDAANGTCEEILLSPSTSGL